MFCLSFNNSVEAREFYTKQQALEILNQKDVKQQVMQFVDSSSSNKRIQLLKLWQENQNIEPLLQEKLLYEATLLLRQSTTLDSIDRAAYQQALSHLLSYESKAYLPLQDGGHELQVVAYEVAASAKATLIHWQIEKIFNQSAKQLINNPAQFLAELSVQQPLENHLGYIKAIDQAAENDLTLLKQSVIQNQTILPMRVMQSLALKTEDPQIYFMLLDQYNHSNQHQALMINMLSRLPTSMNMEQRLEFLFEATSQPELRNSAIIALSPFVDSELRVKEFFNKELSSKMYGGSAAKA
jgi:hypothetical protein